MSPVVRPRARTALAAALVPTAGLVAFAGGSPAAAAAACAAGWTEVAPGVCSLTVTQSGTVTVPAGVTHLEALLVGGGGGAIADMSAQAYENAGQGGQVVFVDDLATTGALQLVVGAGGVWDGEDADGGATSVGAVSAAGGGLVVLEYGWDYDLNERTEVLADPRPAVLPSAVAAGSGGTVVLWPAFAGEATVSGDGARGLNLAPTGPCPPDLGVSASGSDGTGQGAAGVTWFDYTCGSEWGHEAPGTGGSGVVILRYAVASTPTPTPSPSSPTLAATGTSSGAPLAAVAGLLVAGAGALALSTRARRQH